VLTAIATYIQKRYVGERTLDVGAVGDGMATDDNTGAGLAPV
jgi:hypothetical protein